MACGGGSTETRTSSKSSLKSWHGKGWSNEQVDRGENQLVLEDSVSQNEGLLQEVAIRHQSALVPEFNQWLGCPCRMSYRAGWAFEIVMAKGLEESEQVLPTLVGHPGQPRLPW